MKTKNISIVKKAVSFISQGRLILILLSVFCVNAEAGQFRFFDAIKQTAETAPDGYRLVATPYRLERRVIEHAIKVVANHYRSPKLRDFLSERFVNRDRLVDAIQENMPLDAQMRVLSVQAPHVLTQYQKKLDNGNLELLSRVSAIVRTQVEFTDATGGAQRLEESSEWIVNITTQRFTLP